MLLLVTVTVAVLQVVSALLDDRVSGAGPVPETGPNGSGSGNGEVGACMKRFLLEGFAWHTHISSCYDVEAYLQSSLLYATAPYVEIHRQAKAALRALMAVDGAIEYLGDGDGDDKRACGEDNGAWRCQQISVHCIWIIDFSNSRPSVLLLT